MMELFLDLDTHFVFSLGNSEEKIYILIGTVCSTVTFGVTVCPSFFYHIYYWTGLNNTLVIDTL